MFKSMNSQFKKTTFVISDTREQTHSKNCEIKEPSIYPVFPVLSIPQNKQIVDKEKFLFIELFQPINKERVTEY